MCVGRPRRVQTPFSEDITVHIILISVLTLILLTWTIWRAPTNARKWRMGFNSAFKGLNKSPYCLIFEHFIADLIRVFMQRISATTKIVRSDDNTKLSYRAHLHTVLYKNLYSKSHIKASLRSH